MVSPVAALCLLLLHFAGGDALKILVNNPAMAHSHVEFQGAIADILAEAGHTVHLLVPVYEPRCQTSGSAKASKVYRIVPTAPLQFADASFISDPFNRPKNKNTFSMLGDTIKKFLSSTNQVADDILADDALLEELRREKYDVGISEFYEFFTLPLFHAVGIDVKIVSSAVPLTEYLVNYYGIPVPRSYATSTLGSFANTPKLTYLQKIENLYNSAVDRYVMADMADSMTERMRNKFGPEFPHVREIYKNSSLALMNVLEVLDLPKPSSNKLINIGGISRKKVKHVLEPEIEEIFKKANKGVVLFSFGSIADPVKMGPPTRAAFLKAFTHFSEYEFIWKFNPEDVNKSDEHPNVHFVKWMDQNTILGQPELRAFITHCGLNSVTESAYAGKPMVAVPLFADQDYNAAMIVQHRVGVFLELHNIDEARIVEALKKVLFEEEFQENAQRLRRKLLNHPNDPRAAVRKWVEYAAEFGDLHENLNLEAVNMDLFSYFCLDVIVPAVVVAIIALFSVLKIAVFAFGFAMNSLAATKKKVA
ncbi:hypothetical protein QR680_008892 [Steinernema hermaphroditum]|uniref:UDP-glucuronosyltransferase n=1 Tax=Steinernema hermaphroditum TaxID=289476 RepID=A0AA39M8Q4_9BILA|nr:hypothetical protein QR680_008892 [Steinernema hermaphroditum]